MSENRVSFKRVKWGFLLIFILVPILLVASCILWPNKPDANSFDWVQSSTQEDWVIGSPQKHGFDVEKLIDLHWQVESQPSKKLQSLLIIRHGELVFEQYYPVRAEADGTPLPNHFPPAADTHHQMRSITKTVVATVIGQMLYQQQIESLDSSIYSYFPDADQEKYAVKLRHALNFNSGLDWQEWGVYPSDAMNMWLSQDPYRYVLNKAMRYPPGEHHAYQGAMSVLLGGVIENISGVDLQQYTDQVLFKPLGITNYDWFAHEVTGDFLGSSGLYLRSRDLAKLGQLYLNQGMWKGQRIFDQKWAELSLTPSGRFWPNKTIQYGYNWWFPLIEINEQAMTIAGMRGSGGQEMFIVPELDMVFVMTSGAYRTQDEDYPFELLVDFVLPALGIESAEYIAESP